MVIKETLETKVSHSCDVLVCGGGFAGISAALAAAREGSSVILLEKQYMLGGLGTAGLVTIYLPLCDGCGRQVSFGKTITYGQLAALSGYPGAARAVGHAMQKNPLCILIPCHRVLPASGGVGQYSAGKGSETKSALLELEQAFFHL